MVDDPDYFERDPGFYVLSDSRTPASERKVIVIGWEVDKRLLAYPFFGSLIGSAAIAVAVGIHTRSIATGAQVGEYLCGVIAAVFCYVVWRCS